MRAIVLSHGRSNVSDNINSIVKKVPKGVRILFMTRMGRFCYTDNKHMNDILKMHNKSLEYIGQLSPTESVILEPGDTYIDIKLKGSSVENDTLHIPNGLYYHKQIHMINQELPAKQIKPLTNLSNLISNTVKHNRFSQVYEFIVLSCRTLPPFERLGTTTLLKLKNARSNEATWKNEQYYVRRLLNGRVSVWPRTSIVPYTEGRKFRTVNENLDSRYVWEKPYHLAPNNHEINPFEKVKKPFVINKKGSLKRWSHTTQQTNNIMKEITRREKLIEEHLRQRHNFVRAISTTAKAGKNNEDYK